MAAVVQQYQARKSKIAVAEVKTQTHEIHALVNSSMESQLRISAVSLRRVADLTKDPSDAMIATEAERLLKEHISKQQAVDKENINTVKT